MAVSVALPTFAAGEPGNVTNVTAKAKDATTLTLTWDAVKTAQGQAVDHYYIYYGPKSVQESKAGQYELEKATPTNATTYDLTGLTKDTPYYIAVTAFDAADNESEEYSVEASGTPSDKPAVDAPADTLAPTVLNVIAADKNHVLVGFSEKMILPDVLPEASFIISEKADSEKMLDIVSAKMFADDAGGKTVLLETADQTYNVNYLMTVSGSMKDLAGNAIKTGASDSGMFVGSNNAKSAAVAANTELKPAAGEATPTTTKPEDLLLDSTTPTSTTTATPVIVTPTTPALVPVPDQTAPEDVRNLMLSFKEQLQKFVVVMNWEASLNTAKDLMDQIVYMSTDGVTFDTGRSVGATGNSYEMPNLEGGKEYTFKVTTKDATGNESVGVIQSIRLPSTGFGAGFLILSSAFGAHKLLKRRKQKMTKTV